VPSALITIRDFFASDNNSTAGFFAGMVVIASTLTRIRRSLRWFAGDGSPPRKYPTNTATRIHVGIVPTFVGIHDEAADVGGKPMRTRRSDTAMRTTLRERRSWMKVVKIRPMRRHEGEKTPRRASALRTHDFGAAAITCGERRCY